MDYNTEDEREAFNVKTASPAEVESYIGDLQVQIERLQAQLAEIAAITAKG